MKPKILKAALALSLTVVLALLALGRSINDSRDSDRDPITGTWNCVVPPAGGFPQVNVIKNIHADGTMIELDNAAPPSQESPTVGNWIRTGHRTYTLTLEQFSFDAAGTFVGTFHYTNPLTMAPSQNSMDGTFTFTLVDVNGNPLASGDGSVSCTGLGSN